MTKILFLIPTLMHGGAEKVLVNLVNNLDKTKYEVTLFSIFDVGVNKEFLLPEVKYRYHYKKLFRANTHYFNLFSPKKLYKMFIKEKYDLVVAYLEGPSARILSGCPYPNTKKIVWIHIQQDTEKAAATGFRSLKDAQLGYNAFERIVAVSEMVKQTFVEHIQPKVEVEVLYNTNETDTIKILGQETIDWDFSDEVPNIISVGKILHTKGFDRLLEAHTKLLKEGILHTVTILGIGEDQKKLENKIAELGAEKTFRLAGFHKNPYKFIAKSDLYVCSSWREGFSTAVSEALILGIPVVSTNCSGATEMLGEHNEYGIVTDNTTEGIYQGMKKMLENPETLAFYKNKAQERGLFFSKEKTVKAVENLFEKVLYG